MVTKMNFGSNKGYLRLIEMSLAAALILGFMIYLQQSQSTTFTTPPSYDPVVLQETGQNVLRSLDLRDNESNGRSDLRDRLSCDAARWDKTFTDIRDRLPPDIGFTLYSVDINGVSTFKGGRAEGQQPTRTEIVTVAYIVSGEYGNYSNFDNPCVIKLALWFYQ